MTGSLMPRRRVDHGGSNRCGSLHRGEVRVIGSESTGCSYFRQAEKQRHPVCGVHPGVLMKTQLSCVSELRKLSPGLDQETWSKRRLGLSLTGLNSPTRAGDILSLQALNGIAVLSEAL